MPTIGERIKKRREALNMSAQTLGQKIGKDKITIYRYESEQIEGMPVKIVEPLAIALETTPAYLLGWTDDPSFSDTITLKSTAKTETRRLKLFKEKICAGSGNFLTDSTDYTWREFANAPITASFCIQAQGDSMRPKIHDGQILFIQERDKTTMLANDVGVFCYHGDFYCKVLNYRNGEIVLSSYNPKYKDIVIDEPEELHFIGRVL